MLIPSKIHRFNVYFNVENQDAVDSPQIDWFDQNDGQSSFDSLNQFGAPSNSLGRSAWFFRIDVSSQPLLGWGAGGKAELVNAAGRRKLGPTEASIRGMSARRPSGREARSAPGAAIFAVART
jgi:hypothetical protein